jgi:hypothetical protein
MKYNIIIKKSEKGFDIDGKVVNTVVNLKSERQKCIAYCFVPFFADFSMKLSFFKMSVAFPRNFFYIERGCNSRTEI